MWIGPGIGLLNGAARSSGGIDPFTFTVDTTIAGSSGVGNFALPLTTSTGLDAQVDWGDGTSDNITSHTASEVTHTYPSAGTYTIKITGDLLGWQFNNGGDKLKMGDIEKWGALNISVFKTFFGCTNMTCSATDAPTITSTDLRQTFEACSNFDGAIGNWDISNVTNIQQMFFGASSFNQDIGSWDISNVTTFESMFYNATAFDNLGSDNIDNWRFSTTSNISMQGMFAGSTNTTSCKFNRYIGSWNTERVTNMSSMFIRNTAFNQDINTKTINSGLPDEYIAWDTSSVTLIRYMFLYASSFNQDISNWDMSSVTNMDSMFSNAIAFNQDISSWDTSSVTNMGNLFDNADAFDQDISNWDIDQVSNFSNFMLLATGLSTANYDALLIGWEAQAPTYSGSIHFGSSQYTPGGAAEAARTSLQTTYGWVITDGGPA